MAIKHFYEASFIRVEGTETVREIREKMKNKKAKDVLVLCHKEGKARQLGILTDLDISRTCFGEKGDSEETQAQDIIMKEIITIKNSNSVKNALTLMYEKDVKRLLILNKNNEACGIFSTEMLWVAGRI